MPDLKPTDDVEKFVAEQKAFEDRKQGLIDDLLRQKAEAAKAFDDKLAKLGWSPDGSGKRKKSHHKGPETPSSGDAAAKAKTKAKS